MTYYPDTRHITEANVPLSNSYMGENERLKTMNHAMSMFAGPDHRHPQVEDAMKRHATAEFRINRINNRQREFTDRCQAANLAATQFDEQRVARKAMNLLNYERRVKQSCG